MTPTARILVVDDDENIRFFLKEVLERDGHQVIEIESGEEALERIARGDEFDLALVDLRMHGVGGVQVMAALHERTPDTSVIVLTGHASLETAVEVLRYGAHDYLFKPCRTVELRESVQRGLLKRWQALQQRELLDRLKCADPATVPQQAASESPAKPGRFLQCGGLIVDLMRHVITLEGVLLELSPTEFDLVAYLVNEAPRVIPACELVREVQGYDCALHEARDVVRYHIYRIRQKVKEAAGRTDLIRTVRGVGYTICD